MADVNMMKGEFYLDASHFATDSNFEVQRTNHFEIVLDLKDLVDIKGEGGEAYSDHIRMSTKSIGAPKITAEAIELKHGNDTVKVASRPTYEDLQITVYDTLGRDQVTVLQSWFDMVFDHKSKLMGMVSKYKTNGTLYMYSPDCTVIRKWVLEGVWPKDFGQASEFSFDSTEAQTVQFTLSVDRYHEEIVKGL